MGSKYKRMLTVDDLYAFLIKQNTNFNFSAKDSGYQLSVQVPSYFEKVDDDKSDNLLMFGDVKVMHSGRNRNTSNVTDEALEKAAKHLAYKPILANFMEYTDEETGETLKDFTSHDFEVDDDGNTIYIEKQVGCFTSDEPYFKVEEETGHNFLYGKCAIPTVYTDAAAIIKRKGGTKVSVELSVNELEYDAKNKELILADVDIMGLTLLGKNPDTLEDVGEGMKNARLDIADFSMENNSVVIHSNNTVDLTGSTKLIEALEKLNTTLSNFNNNTQINQKGGTNLVKFEELLKKYNVTAEDVTFDYEGLSDEELEQKFKEAFDDDGASGDTCDAGTTDDGNSDPEPASDDNADEGDGEADSENDPEGEEAGEGEGNEPETDDADDDVAVTSENGEENPVEDEACGTDGKKKKKYSVTVGEKSANFEVALDEKIWALSDLVNAQYGESDNCYYSVKVYEKYLIMSDWWTGIAYKQSYTQDGDNFSLTGDRVEVYATYLTKKELDEVEEMRSNYSALVEYKDNAEFAKLHSQREEILAAEKYSVIKDTDEFKSLVEKMDNYSLVDLEKEAKVLFADYITSNASTFSAKNPTDNSKKKFNGGMRFGVGSEKPDADDESSPYGDYFKSLRK